MRTRVSLTEVLSRVYSDRRDRYGYTVLSRTRAIRAIKRGDDRVIRHLIATNLLKILVDAQVILPPKIVCGRQNEYVFLIQKRIRPAVVPSEWSPSMFADAAQLILRAEKALSKHGMTVDDPHPWNILFYNGRPYIVDMGAFNFLGTGVHWSAKRDADIWPAGHIYNALFLYSVALNAAGKGRYVRQAITDWNQFSGSDVALLLLKRPTVLFPFVWLLLKTTIFGYAWRLVTQASSPRWKQQLKSFYLDEISRYVERARGTIIKKMDSSDNHDDKEISAGAAGAVRGFIGQEPLQRIVIYGASQKVLDYIRSVGASRLLIVSPDDVLADKLYRSAPNDSSVAVMNLRSPTPGAGPSNRWILPAFERFNSRVGIFFFDLRELVIEKCLTVTELIEAAYRMSDTGLIVLRKLPVDKSFAGRNYGQVADHVLRACAAQNLDSSEIMHEDSTEMIIAYGCSASRNVHHDRHHE